MKAFDKCPTLVGHYTLSIPFHSHPPIPICSRLFPVLLFSFLSSSSFMPPYPFFFSLFSSFHSLSYLQLHHLFQMPAAKQRNTKETNTKF